MFELSYYNKVWTDRRTDGHTDGQTAVITIGLPHLRWRGPNKFDFPHCKVEFTIFDKACKGQLLHRLYKQSCQTYIVCQTGIVKHKVLSVAP